VELSDISSSDGIHTVNSAGSAAFVTGDFQGSPFVTTKASSLRSLVCKIEDSTTGHINSLKGDFILEEVRYERSMKQEVFVMKNFPAFDEN
jgi:hypothetical protein